MNNTMIIQLITRKGYNNIELLQSGGFGNIYSGNQNGRNYAIKVQISENGSIKDERIKKECQNSLKIKGPNIIHSLATYKDKFKNRNLNIYSIVMDLALYNDLHFLLKYILKGNLLKLFNYTQNFPWLFFISPLTVTLFISHIIKGLQILYEYNLVHNDMKLENLLVDFQFVVKLCDFGIISKAMANFKLTKATWCYEGPEYYNSSTNKIIPNFNDCFKIDYYPIGIILYYMFFRKQFINKDLKDTMYKNKDYYSYIKIIKDAIKEINNYKLNNENELINNFINGKKNNKIKFIQKGLGDLAISLLNINISERPNILELSDNETIINNTKLLKPIFYINQFLEIKLFIEFQKPKFIKRRYKYSLKL